MNCKTECYLAAACIGSSIYMMLTRSSKHVELAKTLNETQIKTYSKIKKERFLIWAKATILGIIVSIMFAKFGNYYLDINNSFNRACIGTLIFYAVQYMVYNIHPKSDYMLNHVENKQQAKAWLAVYKSMKNKWHLGMLLGLIGYFLLSITIFKNKQRILL